MKKRIFAASLVLILMLSLVLTACGNKVEVKNVKTGPDTVFTFSLENTNTKNTMSGTAKFADDKNETASVSVEIPEGHYNITVKVPDPETGSDAVIATTTYDCPKGESELKAVRVTYTESTRKVTVEAE